MKISIENYGMKYNTELDDESNIYEVGNALRGLLLAITFLPETVNKILPDDVEDETVIEV